MSGLHPMQPPPGTAFRMTAAMELHQFVKRYSDPRAPEPVMVRRALHGGPWDGRGITVPEDRLHMECGWMSGMYCLDADGAFEFLQHTGGCERPYARS